MPLGGRTPEVLATLFFQEPFRGHGMMVCERFEMKPCCWSQTYAQ